MPRRQFGTLFQIQRHQLNDSPLSRFVFIWEKTSSPRTKKKGSNSGCSSNKHDHAITTRTSFMARNLTPLTGKWSTQLYVAFSTCSEFGLANRSWILPPPMETVHGSKNLCPLCPSCAQVNKTCSHILFCTHVGRVDALMKSIDLLEQWLEEADRDPVLHKCIVKYARGRGQRAMTDICRGMDF
jgi:hypothetical protein